jgi:hypothetical protein
MKRYIVMSDCHRVTGIEITLDSPARPVSPPPSADAATLSPHFALVKCGYQVGAEPVAKGTGSFPTTRSLAIARTVLEESKK